MHDSFTDLGPPPPYSLEPLRPSRSTPNLRQQAAYHSQTSEYAASPGIDVNGRLRCPSPGPPRMQSYTTHDPVPSTPTYVPYRPYSPASHQSRPSSRHTQNPSALPGPPPTSGWKPQVAVHTQELRLHNQIFPLSRRDQGQESLRVATQAPTLPTRPELLTATSEPITASSQAASKDKNFLQNAFDETVFFAGGLLPHPSESTRHFSILRHSPALVWYRGPSTTVTITIFSDEPLPSTRSIWLQRKGYSGNTGMALKSMLGTTTSWLDVTPSAAAPLASVPATDERAYQRDMAKFAKKASGNAKRHLARETHVVRIPAAAEDGYFRLVLCSGSESGKKKTLCPSPVFRVASTSTDASMVKGASLATMPIELGVKVGSTIASNVVNRYVGPARMAATAATTGVVRRVEKKGFVAARAREVAMAKAGLRTHVSSMETRYAGSRGAGYAALQAEDLLLDGAPPEVVGPDEGPAPPFPIKFDGKVCRGTGRGGMELGVPTANLGDVPEDIRLRMRGVYMAWACIVPRPGLPETLSPDWHEAIVTVGPSPYATPSIVAKNIVTVHFIHEFGGVMFYDARVKVLIMGQLRRGGASIADGIDEALGAYASDVMVTVASLSRDNWEPHETRERMKTLKSQRSFAEKYMDARDKLQKQVDRIPVHWAGVRTEGAAMRDQAMGPGGFWIAR
ncbi:hypothetical protein BN1723_013618 [Verticillium longisporum]|uniref:Riboflavin kinase n=1 Tax=Verticillium longisporum TaxID=100787 RepID=A0A0G4LVI8_VERLO|nr:hypothetical protein BN1723_013618 [Verticillium longisporum]